MHDPAQTICHHLMPFLTMLEEQGSTVRHVDESAWSNCLLNVALDKGPSLRQARQMFTLSSNVTLWFNDDSHYELENGLACRECKHALSWPRVDRNSQEMFC
jgi:hypothetical protein